MSQRLPIKLGLRPTPYPPSIALTLPVSFATRGVAALLPGTTDAMDAP